MQTKAYLSVSEVARLVSVSRTTASGWVNRGELKCARISKTLVRVSSRDLQEFLNNNGLAA